MSHDWKHEAEGLAKVLEQQNKELLKKSATSDWDVGIDSQFGVGPRAVFYGYTFFFPFVQFKRAWDII